MRQRVRSEVARIVAQIRERWPRVEILLRADSGFARDELMGWCEDNGVDYLFGLARNPRLLAEIDEALAAAAAEHAATGQPARQFDDFPYTTLDSWRRERRVVAKAEHLAKVTYGSLCQRREGVLPGGVDETRKMEHPQCRRLRRSGAYQQRSV
jgi:hypothetical protein